MGIVKPDIGSNIADVPDTINLIYFLIHKLWMELLTFYCVQRPLFELGYIKKDIFYEHKTSQINFFASG